MRCNTKELSADTVPPKNLPGIKGGDEREAAQKWDGDEQEWVPRTIAGPGESDQLYYSKGGSNSIK